MDAADFAVYLIGVGHYYGGSDENLLFKEIL
jgi:hypothetical protein